MGSVGWQQVTQTSPCHVCGTSGWCSVSADGKKAICRRRDSGAGVLRTDKSGQDYWLYDLNGSRPSAGLSAGPSVQEKNGASTPPDAPEKADPETLDRVYRALLDELPLDDAHREDLLRRGLTEDGVGRGGYRSLPQRDRYGAARAVVERFGTEVCSRVPGLRRDAGRWTLAGAAGMLVPVRDVEGRVVALKVRADDAGEGSKYTYLSSQKYGGPGPGAQVHVPLHAGLGTKVARLTEGELKADAATALTGTLTVSAPGVSSWRAALPVLEKLGAETVHLAFDADARENEHVSRALQAAFGALEEQGYGVVLEAWRPELGKGIDDLLVAGHRPQLLSGSEARAAVNGIRIEATGASLVLKNTLTAKELLDREFPEPQWIVPGIVPEGATVLAGKPKMGKSWLALGVALAVATGGVALGRGKVEPGAALYLALEDNPRRLQSRLKKLLPSGAAPERLVLADRWPRLGDGGLETLEAWLVSSLDARLVVIDTLAKFRNGGNGRNVYKEDYEAVEPLVELAARHNVAVIIVHHLRKMAAEDPLDQVSGSMGLTGGADGALVLNRERGRADAYLYVTGRDIEEEQELALAWDATTATWKIAGDAEEYRISKERLEIVECLRSLGEPAGPKEVSEALGKTYNNVKQLLFKMGNDGDVRNIGGGKYVATDNPDNPDNRDESSTSPGGSSTPSPSDDIHRRNEDPSRPAVTPVTEVTGSGGRSVVGPPLLVSTEDELCSVTEGIKSAEIVGVDIETTGLNPRTDRVRLISLSTPEGSWLVDCFGVDPRPLFDELARKKLVMHNGQFDLGFLAAMGFDIGDEGEVIDTMLTSQLLEYKEAV